MMRYEFRGKTLHDVVQKSLQTKGSRSMDLAAPGSVWTNWVTVYDLFRDGRNVKPDQDGSYTYTVDIRIQISSELETSFDVEFDEFGTASFEPNFRGFHRVTKTLRPDPNSVTQVRPYVPSSHTGQVRLRVKAHGILPISVAIGVTYN